MKKFGTSSFVTLVIATLFMLGVTLPAVAADDSIVTVTMSGLTFVGAGGAEKVSISFNWDVTTNTIVPGTVSTSSSGVIEESFDAFNSYGSVVGGEGFLFQDASGDRVSVNTCGFDCGTFPSIGTYNTIDVTLLCGPSDSCSAAGLNGLHPSSGTFTVNTALVLYDDFGRNFIDPNKWVAAQNFDPDLRESVRRIEFSLESSRRGLHMLHRAYSATTDDIGSSGGLFGLSFINPSVITTVSFKLKVSTIAVTGCTTNPQEAVTGAEFRGNFFNINSSPTDPSGDVQANIGISRSPGGPLFVAGFVSVGFGGPLLGYQILGTVAEGSENTLLVQWDQPHHRFIFQLNGGNPVVEPYNVSDTTPPFSPFKNLDLARVVPHCTSTPRPYAFEDAEFRNVYINP